MKKIAKIFSLIFLFFVMMQNCYAFDDDYVYKSELKKAYSVYSEALNTEKNAENYYNMCKTAYYFNDFKQAAIYCKSAISELNKTPDDNLSFLTYSMLGDIYLENSNNKKVILENYKDAMKYETDETDKFELAKLYLNTAKTYYKYDDRTFAFEVYIPKVEEILRSEKEPKFNILRARLNKFYADDEKAQNHNLKNKDYIEQAMKDIENTGEYNDTALKAELYKDLSAYYLKYKNDKRMYEEYYRIYCEETEKLPYVADMSDRATLAVMTASDLDDRLKTFPYDIVANIEYGYRYIGDIEISEKYFNRAININPENAHTMIAIANAYCEAYLKTGNMSYSLKMSEYIKKATEIAKFSPEIYSEAALMKLSAHAYKSADLYYNKYIEYAQDKQSAYCKIASDYWKFESNTPRVKKVIYYLEEALKLNSNIDDSYKKMLISAYDSEKNNKKTKKNDEKVLNMTHQ